MASGSESGGGRFTPRQAAKGRATQARQKAKIRRVKANPTLPPAPF